jgi:2'-5' RNA ligase
VAQPPAGRDAEVRLFVALALPPDIRDAVADWSDRALRGLRRAGPSGPAADLRPGDPASLHVTLCFLGRRARDAVPVIAELCRASAPGPPVALMLTGPVWLPPGRPRVLALGLESDPDELTPLQARLAGALAARGLFEPEDRPFLPHVTVARVRHGARIRGTRELKLPRPAGLVETADNVVLYRSHLSSRGGRYEALETIALG